MITKYPWFGPKEGIGWGWTPITWEGWSVVALFLVLLILSHFLLASPIRNYAIAGEVAVLILICFLTGLPPG